MPTVCILGAVTHSAAEYRRVRILKNGFDALCCAHDSFDPAFLNTCDQLGVLVIKKAFDEGGLDRFRPAHDL